MKIILIIIIIILIILFSKNKEKKEKFVNNLKFSNTMKWDKEITNKFFKDNKIYLNNYYKKIIDDMEKKNIVKPPPKNDSYETKIELNQLMMKKIDRVKRQKNIEFEIRRDGSLENIIDNDEFLDVIIKALDFIDPIIMYFKHKFDRVRPNFLRKKINPSIEVPGHPAYPSGHATQAYTTALILGYLFPDKKSYYYKRGENVAKNREYAGVHYASDTVAGERIATYLLPIIVKKFNLKSKK